MDESFEIEGIDESLVTIEVETENQNEFKCNVCQFSSNYKRNLTRRMDSKHAAPAHEVTTKTQLCSICGKMYKTPYGLSLHVKTIMRRCLDISVTFAKGGLLPFGTTRVMLHLMILHLRKGAVSVMQHTNTRNLYFNITIPAIEAKRRKPHMSVLCAN